MMKAWEFVLGANKERDGIEEREQKKRRIMWGFSLEAQKKGEIAALEHEKKKG